jgi:PAS domain S-box-containing protein
MMRAELKDRGRRSMVNQTKPVRILVVEDEFITATDIKNSLKGMGYEIPAVVDSGPEAIRKTGELAPSLVLMDISLKGKMNGIEAANQIREKYDIPVIYLTAHSDESTFRGALASEPFGYILKPFEAREMKISIEMALYKHALDRALRESEETNHVLLNATSDIMFLLDPEKRFLAVNEALATRAGVPADGLTGTNASDLVTREILTPFMACVNVDRAQKGAVRFEEELNGKWFDSRIYPVITQDGGVIKYAVYIRDITGRKQMEGQLLREKRDLVIYKAMLDEMDDILIATTDMGDIFFVNEAFQKRLGYALADVKSKHISVLKDPNDPFPMDRNAFFVEKKAVWDGSSTFVTKHHLKLKTLLKSTPVIRDNITICRVFVLRERLV